MTEGEDYIDFNQTVPLELGRATTLVVIEDALIDDQILEKTQEYFLIRMEVPDQPMSDMIHIIDGEDHDEVTILDSGGRFPMALMFNINCATILF